MSRKASNSRAPVSHAARQHTESPVVREAHAQAGVLVCTRCKARHHDKHWYAADEASALPKEYEVREVLCPGCHSVENRICKGEVILEGAPIELMKSTVHGFIANVEDKCWRDNPCSRILSFNDLGERIEVATTSEWLAMRIGKEMKKSFKGRLRIQQHPEEGFVRINWKSA